MERDFRYTDNNLHRKAISYRRKEKNPMIFYSRFLRIREE